MCQGFYDIEIEREIGKFGNPCSGMLHDITHRLNSSHDTDKIIHYNYRGKSQY